VAKRWLGETGELFRSLVVKSVTVDDTYHMYFGRPLVCFNSMHLDAALTQIPSGISTVYLHVTDLVTLIDHTAASALLEFVENFKRSGRGVAAIIGLDRLRARSHAEASMRISAPVLAQERAQALDALARISVSYVSPEQPDPVAFLDRISLTHIGVNASQEEHVINEAVIRAWRYLARTTKAMSSSVRSLFVFEDAESFAFSDHDLSLSGLSGIELGDVPSEIEKFSLSSGEHRRPIIGNTSPSDHPFM
jgi:hypothetical protein